MYMEVDTGKVAAWSTTSFFVPVVEAKCEWLCARGAYLMFSRRNAGKSDCGSCERAATGKQTAADSALDPRALDAINVIARERAAAPPDYICAPGCSPAAPCMTREEFDRVEAETMHEREDHLRRLVCAAQFHLAEERGYSVLMQAKGVADPQATVRVSRRIDGVRWNGRAWR